MRFMQTLYTSVLAGLLVGPQDDGRTVEHHHNPHHMHMTAPHSVVSDQQVSAHAPLHYPVQPDTLPVNVQGHPATWSVRDRLQIDTDFPAVFGISVDSAFQAPDPWVQPLLVQTQNHPDAKSRFTVWQTIASGHVLQDADMLTHYQVGDTLRLAYQVIGYDLDDQNLNRSSPVVTPPRPFLIDTIVSLAQRDPDDSLDTVDNQAYYAVDQNKMKSFITNSVPLMTPSDDHVLAMTIPLGPEIGPVRTQMAQMRRTSVVQTFLDNLSETVWVMPVTGAKHAGHKHPVGLVLRPLTPCKD